LSLFWCFFLAVADIGVAGEVIGKNLTRRNARQAWAIFKRSYTMKKIILSLALGAGALLATAASAAPIANGIAVLPDNGIENVRMVCDQSGRCWRERGPRRVDDSYNYAPREGYVERRGYNDGYNNGYNSGPSVGIGVGPVGVGIGVGPRY
jgi:hypothetical protein